MSSQKPTPVLFSYKASPYAQKIHYLLTAAGIPYSDLPQPPVLPRPDLEDLGITYRRIPLLAVGRDVYADSAAIIDVILNELGGKHKIETSKADKAYELWGNDTFKTVVPLLPVQALTPQFVSDRETIFPLLAHPDRLKAQQPIALADLKSRLAWVEDVYLADRKEGASLSLADIHVIWALRWVLQDLGAATRYPGLDQTTYPRVYSLISALPKKPAGKVLNKQDAHAAILSSPASDSHSFSVAANDPLGIAQGTPVTVENADTKPGAHPQKGKLIGTSKHEIVLALETGVRLHYPRAGYLVREEGKARL